LSAISRGCLVWPGFRDVRVGMGWGRS